MIGHIYDFGAKSLVRNKISSCLGKRIPFYNVVSINILNLKRGNDHNEYISSEQCKE